MVSDSVPPVGGTMAPDGLRTVERDVLIPKMMRERAMQLCGEYVRGESHNIGSNYSATLI